MKINSIHLLLVLLALILLVGCTTKIEESSSFMTFDECSKVGGKSIESEASPVSCEKGTTQIGLIEYGDEGAICCK